MDNFISNLVSESESPLNNAEIVEDVQVSGAVFLSPSAASDKSEISHPMPSITVDIWHNIGHISFPMNS